MEKFTCSGCSTVVEEDDKYFDDMQWSNITNEPVCFGCFEEDLSNPSTVVKVDSEGLSKFIMGDLFVVGDCEYEVPDWFTQFIPEDWAGRKYVSSGGWRGFYSTFKTFQGVEELAGGWHTGWADETVSRKLKVGGLLANLETGDLVPPVPIYVLLEPTSNLFSTTTTIFTATKDVSVITEWLEQIGFSVDSLKFALS